MFDEKVVVNGIVALLATGGSTNHTMHWWRWLRAAGIIINWDDFSDLSDVVPLLARLYPTVRRISTISGSGRRSGSGARAAERRPAA